LVAVSWVESDSTANFSGVCSFASCALLLLADLVGVTVGVTSDCGMAVDVSGGGCVSE